MRPGVAAGICLDACGGVNSSPAPRGSILDLAPRKIMVHNEKQADSHRAGGQTAWRASAARKLSAIPLPETTIDRLGAALLYF